MGVQYAKITHKRCPMSDETCAAKVIEHISKFYTRNAAGELTINIAEIVENSCGRYVKGKNKGKLRGWATISVCTEGGWKKEGPGEGNGGVIYPGTVLGISIGDDFSGKVYFSVGRTI